MGVREIQCFYSGSGLGVKEFVHLDVWINKSWSYKMVFLKNIFFAGHHFGQMSWWITFFTGQHAVSALRTGVQHVRLCPNPVFLPKALVPQHICNLTIFSVTGGSSISWLDRAGLSLSVGTLKGTFCGKTKQTNKTASCLITDQLLCALGSIRKSFPSSKIY